MNGMNWKTRATVIGAVAVTLVMLFSIGGTVFGGGGAAAASGTSTMGSTAPASTTGTTAASSLAPASSDSLCPNASPHCGTLYMYEVAPFGAATEDPDILYDTVSEEPAMNVFQTLVTYAGNSSTAYVPELATCVPGTAACTSLYGSDLVVDNSTSGAPQYYTFVIGPSHFYDPSTGASWQVYPTDVMYSFARSEIWASGSPSGTPGVGVTGGWDTAQILLPTGSATWDGGMHYPYNNTPQQSLLTAMFVNDSAYCPSSAMNGVSSFGCITFNAYSGGVAWPFFMEAVTQVFSGSAILSCGWYSYTTGEKLGFVPSAAAKADGDGPCLLPGSATSSNSAAFTSAVTAMAPTAWDSVELLASSLTYPAFESTVQWSIVGSGPYYLVSAVPTIGYQLKASPAYVANSNCPSLGLPGCQPAPGTFASDVLVYWEASDTVGSQEFAAGQADFAAILPTDTPTLLALAAQGKVNWESFPTLSIFFWAFTLNFSSSAMKAILPSGDTFNIPQYFFASVAARNLLTAAWPYAAYNNTIDTVDGVSYGFNYGGVIPAHMANYYPSNITWPSDNPADSAANYTNPSMVGSPAWWWVQGTTPGSPEYNASLAACTSSKPCVYPIIGQLGAPQLDEGIALYITEIEKITGGAITPYDYDISFEQAVVDSVSSLPGTSPIDFYTLGWIPDYPDPSNNIEAMAASNETYTTGNSLWQTWNDGSYTSTTSTCSAVGPAYNDPSSYTALLEWSNWTGSLSAYHGQIPDACQGWAYDTFNDWSASTAHESNITTRTFQYNLESRIINDLALYLYVDQSNQVYSASKWVNLDSVNSNTEVGGGGDQYWYAITFLPKSYSATFTESGLTSGTSWSVLFAGQTLTSTSSSITAPVVPGSYNYTILLVPGYKVTSTISGALAVSTSSLTTSVGFTAVSPVTYPVYILQSGLLPGTPYTVAIQGAGGVYVTSDNLSIALPAGTYTYTASLPTAYKAISALSGSIVVGGSATISLAYQGVTFVSVPVTLTLGSSSAVTAVWTAYATGYGSALWPESTPGSTVTVWEANNSLIGYVGTTVNQGVPGLLYPSVQGATVVVGNATSGPTVVVNFSAAALAARVTFASTGLPADTTWYLSVNGYNSSMNSSVITTFTIAMGVYTYSAWAPGYEVAHGTFTDGGLPSSLVVSFVTPPVVTTTTTTVSSLAYALIGVLAAVAVIFLVLALVFARRRKPPTPTSPQSWEQTTTPPGGTEGTGGMGGGSGGT